MANYNSMFSAAIPDLTPAEAEWIETDLAPVDPWDLDEAELAALLERAGLPDLDETWPAFEWEIQTHPQGLELWLYAEDHFNADHVISFVGRFIERWRPDYVFQMTWADTCNKPHVDAFGGGWLIVTKDQVLSGTTGEAVQEALDRLGGAYLSAQRYMVIELDCGVAETPRMFNTRVEMDQYLEEWAVEAGYEDFEDYEAHDSPEQDVLWYTLDIQAGELSPDVTVSVA